MTHGMCCGGASSMRMLANAKQQKAEEPPKTKDAALKQEKASANKFQDKLKQFSGSFSFKSKQEPKAPSA